jgi:hypothetical protein
MAAKNNIKLKLVENRLKNNRARRQKVLDAVNFDRKRHGLPAVKVNIDDWIEFWKVIKPLIEAILPIILALL